MKDFTNYKPINTSGARDFGEDTNDIEVVIEDEIETELLDAEQEIEEPKEPVQPKKPAFQAPKKPHRSQKRIQQLAQQKRDLEAQLEEERRKNQELQRSYVVADKNGKEGTKLALTKTIEALTAQLRQSMVDGDADKTVELQDALMNAKMELRSIESVIKNIKEPEPVKPAPKAQEVSHKAMEWVEDHPQFKTDPVFYGAAIALNNKLIAEGFDSDSDEFYEELNSRLAPKFPEVFGDLNESVVESEEDTDSSDTDGEELTDVKPKSVKPSPKQTVAASARPVGKTIPVRKTQQVTLSDADLAMATRMGLDPKKYALRKMHMSKNRGEDGYAPIFIPTKD